MPKKLLLIGLDGATWNNLLPWIVNGKLPFLRELVFKGNRGTLISTIPSTTCPALPCFYTGSSPTKTTVFSFRNREGKIVDSLDIKGERFWDVLGDHGVRCFVSGVVTTYPAFIKNGVLVADPFLSPNKEYFVWPKTEEKHFEGYLMDFINRKESLKWQKSDRKKLLEAYMIAEERRYKLVKEYLRTHEFDFILHYFLVSDRVQHLLWDTQELVLECYHKVDKWIKHLADDHPEHEIVIFSDHGFGPTPNKAFYLNSWLYKKGLFKYRNRWCKFKDWLKAKLYYDTGWFMEKYLPIRTYERMKRFLHRDKKTEKGSWFIGQSETDSTIINKNHTDAYLSQKWGVSIIYPREAPNYEQLRDSLLREMKELVDEENQLIFVEVYKTEELHIGADSQLPDITFLANPSYDVRGGYNKKIFDDIRIRRRQEGSHDCQRQGILISPKSWDVKDLEITELAGKILKQYEVKI